MNKPNLAMAYNAKKKSKSCPDCMSAGGKCQAHGGKAMMAEGGEVDDMKPLNSTASEHNEDLDAAGSPSSDDMGSSLDRNTMTAQADSDMSRDLPRMAESLSLAAEIMADRKRRAFAKGGLVGQDGSSDIDAPDMADLSNNSDEGDAKAESGRETRGMNIAVSHVMDDEDHDQSNPSDDSRDGTDDSLVGQILRDRKNRRR